MTLPLFGLRHERPILDPPRAEHAKQVGMAKAEAATSDEQRDEMMHAIHAVCFAKSTFTSDDVWVQLDKHEGTKRLGPCMNAARKNGWCVPAVPVDFRMSQRPLHHKCPVRVWRSLIVRG